MNWWFGDNSLWKKWNLGSKLKKKYGTKSTNWWTGRGSWIGNLLGQSKYGSDVAGAEAEKYAEVGKYAVGALLIYMLIK